LRFLVAAVVLWAGCGGEEGFDSLPDCEAERRASFGGLPAGPLSEASVDGLRLLPLGGSVEVQHGSGGAVLLFVGGGVAFISDCLADQVEIVFDRSQGALMVSLFPSEYGGELIVSASTNSLPLVPVDADWDRATLSRGEDSPRVARADISGGAVEPTVATSVVLREIAFLTASE